MYWKIIKQEIINKKKIIQRTIKLITIVIIINAIPPRIKKIANGNMRPKYKFPTRPAIIIKIPIIITIPTAILSNVIWYTP